MKMGAKTKERIARIIGEHFTTSEIVNVFTDANITTDEALYAKWRIILDAFSRVKTEEGFFHIIEEFCHPLNFPDLTVRTAFIEKLNAILTYENLEIRATDKKTEIGDVLGVTHEFMEKMEDKYYNDLLLDIDEVETLLNIHQSYMDVIEIFCQDTKKPTKELNEAYLFLAQKIQQIIADFRLKEHEISMYKPFIDLYSAESEWNGSGKEFEIRTGPKLSWDGVRPSLHNVHSNIMHLLMDIRDQDKEDDEMTGDEKRLEQINTLISKKRTVKITSKTDDVKKIEILHKYEEKKALKKILKNSVVKFDDTIPAIFVDEVEIPLPAYGKEHYLCRAIWKRKAEEAIDWSKIYNDMEGKKADFLPDKELWRYVYDAKNDVNKRVKGITGTTEDIFEWNKKSIKRRY